ncbi:hypothetical protein D3C85_1222910 [compost metagenome]
MPSLTPWCTPIDGTAKTMKRLNTPSTRAQQAISRGRFMPWKRAPRYRAKEPLMVMAMTRRCVVAGSIDQYCEAKARATRPPRASQAGQALTTVSNRSKTSPAVMA